MLDSVAAHADPSARIFEPSTTFSPPDSIDRAAHGLAIYELADVEQIAEAYRTGGVRWFYERHTPDLLAPFLDSTNVPLIEYNFGSHRNPVMTSQAALAFYNGYLDTGSEEYLDVFKTNVDWLLENHDDYYLRYDFPWRHGGRLLERGWVSAMGQGEALAAVSSAYHLTGEQKYLDAATGFFETLYRNTDSTWAFTVDEQGYYWLEEYPNPDTCHVLNGKLFGLWGLWAYYVVTDDSFALELFAAGIRTIADHYPIWNIRDKDESRYCLHGLYFPFYHETHLRQFTDYLTYFELPEFDAATELFRRHPTISGSHEKIDFGFVALGDSTERRTTLYNKGTDTLDIANVSTHNAAFSVANRSAFLAPGDSLVIPIRFAPVNPLTVKSTLTVSSNARLMRIDLVGVGVDHGLTAEETTLEFANVMALATDTLELRVKNQLRVEVSIDSVVTRSAAFDVAGGPYSIEPDMVAVLPVVFAPEMIRSYSDTAFVHVDGAIPLAIRLVGVAVSPLILSGLDGSSTIDFGNVPIGRSDTLEALIDNVGLAPVTVSDVLSAQGDIEVLDAVGVGVVAGQSARRLRVVFAPRLKGIVTDTLLITTDLSADPMGLPVHAEVTTGVGVADEEIPDAFALEQNYPNPFRSSTFLRYRLPQRAHVRMAIFNALGQVVRVVVDRIESAGVHTLEVSLDGLPGGVYFCRMESGSFSQTTKIVLL